MLLKMKIRFFPVTLGPMRFLTARGISLHKWGYENSIQFYETYPGAAYDIHGIPRKILKKSSNS